MAKKVFRIECDGKSYVAAEIDGKYTTDTEYCDITLTVAEEALDDVLADGKHEELDNTIFGFAPRDLILHGTEKEIGDYANSLL